MDILLPWRQNQNQNRNSGGLDNVDAEGAGSRAEGPPSPGRGQGHFPINPNPRIEDHAIQNGSARDRRLPDYPVLAGGENNAVGARPNGLANNFPFLDPHNFFRRDNNVQQQNRQQLGRDISTGNNIYQNQHKIRGQESDRNLGNDGGGNGIPNHSSLLPPSLSTSPLQSVLDELNMSILPHDIRLCAVLKASQLFDHRDKRKHDYELHEGAARILYQKLAFVLTLCLQSNLNSSSGYSYDSLNSYNMPVTQGRDINANVHLNGVHVSHNRNDDDASAVTSASEAATHFNNKHTLGREDSSQAVNSNNRSMSSFSSSNANTSIASMQRMRSTRSAQASDADYEIGVLTACLEMVHRASNESIVDTWHTIGLEALPILVQLLERPFSKVDRVLKEGTTWNQSANVIENNLALAVNRENKLTVQKVTKILAVYSLIPEAKVPMAACDGLLSVLVKITDTQNLNRMKSIRPTTKRIHNAMNINKDNNIATGSIRDVFRVTTGANGVSGTTAGGGLYMTEAARFNAIAVLTNLAAVEQNRMLMLSEPGLVDNIARVVHNERSDVARQCSSLAIMNLSNGDSEHVPELAGNDLILETIIKLIRDDDLETRRNAAIALFNVACADENTVKLVRYKDGLILDVLMQCLSISPDDPSEDHENDIRNDVRTNAAEALFNISCSSIEETTDRMANHAGLLESLAMILRSTTGKKEVKLYCAATLRRMAEIIHAPKRGQVELLSALVKASVWSQTTCIAEAYLSQARVETNRNTIVRHNGLLNALSKLALSIGGPESERIRMISVSAIEHMSREGGTSREILSQHEGIMLAMTRASYLTSSTNDYGSRSDMSTDNAMRSSNAPHGDDQSVETSPSIISHRRFQIALKQLVGAM